MIETLIELYNQYSESFYTGGSVGLVFCFTLLAIDRAFKQSTKQIEEQRTQMYQIIDNLPYDHKQSVGLVLKTLHSTSRNAENTHNRIEHLIKKYDL